MIRFHRVLAGFAAVLFAGSGQAAEAEKISIPGPGASLSAVLFRPSGPGPFPAVVALHGCGGLLTKRGQLSARDLDWGRRLSSQGFLVLMPDSFGSRGMGSQCAAQDRVSGPLQPTRVADAKAARTYLQERPDVKRTAISLLGWSNGGTAVLHTLQGDSAFAKAVAFYPGCRTLAEHGTWRTTTPLLLLMGADDRWTSPDACRTLAAAAAQRREPVTAHFYAGAVHDFDHPGLARRTRQGLAATASGTGEAEVGTDPAARADAIGRVLAFLAR